MAETFKKSSFLISFLDITLIAFLIFDFGFNTEHDLKIYKSIALPLIVLGLILFNGYKYWKYKYDASTRKRAGYNVIILVLLVLVDVVILIVKYEGSLVDTFHENRRILENGLLFYFFIRLTFLMRSIYQIYFNPAILFVGSYLLVALVGTFLLMLPSATTRFITFTEALFTSVSAVCGDGLLIVDTEKDLTLFGQTIIITLIQIGGLGMITFTSFFAYFFKSGSSFKENLFMKDFLGEQLGNILKLTMQIVAFSLLIEIVGAVLIYDSIKSLGLKNPIFYSIFHAISAYCTAGFSTISSNFQGAAFRFNYYLHWVIIALSIFGGIGYLISLNFIRYTKQFFINLFFKKKRKSTVRIITLNTKIVVYTTIILTLLGVISFLILEYNSGLVADRTFFGKLTASMFSTINGMGTGFSIMNYSVFSPSSLLILILIMWVGTSPGSTGSGIKTSSIALATLNIFAIARNKTNIEIGTRRVATEAVRRAFSIIVISLIFIGVGVFLILLFDPEFSLMEVAFEVFSAFSDIGYSLGITEKLSIYSQYILIVIMLLGRIGLINIMTGLLKNVGTTAYEYPRENILIN